MFLCFFVCVNIGEMILFFREFPNRTLYFAGFLRFSIVFVKNRTSVWSDENGHRFLCTNTITSTLPCKIFRLKQCTVCNGCRLVYPCCQMKWFKHKSTLRMPKILAPMLPEPVCKPIPKKQCEYFYQLLQTALSGILTLPKIFRPCGAIIIF